MRNISRLGNVGDRMMKFLSPNKFDDRIVERVHSEKTKANGYSEITVENAIALRNIKTPEVQAYIQQVLRKTCRTTPEGKKPEACHWRIGEDYVSDEAARILFGPGVTLSECLTEPPARAPAPTVTPQRDATVGREPVSNEYPMGPEEPHRLPIHTHSFRPGDAWWPFS